MKRVVTASILVLLAGVSVLAVAEKGSTALHKRAQRLEAKAYRAYEAGDLAAADRLYASLRAVKPEEPIYAEHHAAVLARAGRNDEAYRALEQAAALGLFGFSTIEGDPELEALRAEPRLAEIEERLGRNADAFKERQGAAQRPLPAAEAATYASWAALQEAVGRERKQLEADRGWPSWQTWSLAQNRMDQRHLAAMRRYNDEHAGADRRDAMLGELRRRIDVASPWSSFWRTDQAALIRESASRYLEAFPNDAARNEALLYRAVAAMRGVVETWEAELDPGPKLRCADARADLETLSKGAPADGWTADALGFSALCAMEADPRDAPAARAKIDRFLSLPDRSAQNRTPFQFLHGQVRVEKIRLDGLPAFEVTSLDGRRWTPAALQGKVALIEFWSPG